jgi:hypothetical protein
VDTGEYFRQIDGRSAKLTTQFRLLSLIIRGAAFNPYAGARINIDVDSSVSTVMKIHVQYKMLGNSRVAKGLGVPSWICSYVFVVQCPIKHRYNSVIWRKLFPTVSVSNGAALCLLCDTNQFLNVCSICVRNVYRLLVGKPEGKRPLGRPSRWMDNIKKDLLEIGVNIVDWIGRSG